MKSTKNEEKEKPLKDEMTDNTANEVDTHEEKDQPQQAEETKELTAEEALQQQLDQANETIANLQDKLLRQIAEFDNYRKRTIKEKAELIKNGGEKTIAAILPVIDDFERALQNMKGEGEEIVALRDGVELIYNKILKTLQQEGLQKIETENQEFNTDYHEAIALIPAPADELKGKILDCVQTGYLLNDKVIRHAKVAVGQ